MIEEYGDIFEDKLGEYKNFVTRLELKEEINPIFLKHRQIPFAYKLAVEKELNRLESAGAVEYTISSCVNAKWKCTFVYRL